MRAEMATALTDDASFDLCAADRAGFSGALIDPEMVLKIPAAVHPVDAGAVARDPFGQRLTDGGQK